MPMRGADAIREWTDPYDDPATVDVLDALVLAGGGANGAWQAGRLIALWEQGERWRSVIGVSAGAGNAIGAAMADMQRIRRLWSNLGPDQVFERDPSRLHTALRLLLPWGRRNGLRDTSPLYRTILEALGQPAWRVPCWIGWCNYHSTAFELDEISSFPSQIGSAALRAQADVVMASMAIPGLHEPHQVLTPGMHGPAWGYDGGTRSNCPVGAAIDLGARRIRAIIPSPEDPEYRPQGPSSAWDVAFRALDTAMNENTNTGLRETARWNDFIRALSHVGRDDQRGGKIEVELLVDRPVEPVGSSTDFRSASIQRRLDAGYAWVRPS
jgi:NTE family protein